MNRLVHKTDFEKILADYQLSVAAQQTLAATKLVLLVGPSASGRNTIIRHLMAAKQYHFIVSDTTRQPRVNDGIAETDGIEYWFRSEDDILADLRAGQFLEAEVIHGQQVSGISIRELARAHDSQQVAVCDVDIGGIANVKKLKPDTVAVLILPPDFATWQQRLSARGQLPKAELSRRLETACTIFQTALTNQDLVIIINDDYKHAADQVDKLAISGLCVDQTPGLTLAKQLLTETKAYLTSL